MRRHIKTFGTHADYEDFINEESREFLWPNISICEEEYHGHFNDNGTIDKAHTVIYKINIYEEVYNPSTGNYDMNFINSEEFNSINELFNFVLPSSGECVSPDYNYIKYNFGQLGMYEDHRKPDVFLPIIVDGTKPEYDWDWDGTFYLALPEGKCLSGNSYQFTSAIEDYLQSQDGEEKVLNVGVERSKLNKNCQIAMVYNYNGVEILDEDWFGSYNNMIDDGNGSSALFYDVDACLNDGDGNYRIKYDYGTYEGEDIEIEITSANMNTCVTLDDYFLNTGWSQAKIDSIKTSMINQLLEDKWCLLHYEYDEIPYSLEIYKSSSYVSGSTALTACTLHTAYTFDTPDEVLDFSVPFDYYIGSWYGSTGSTGWCQFMGWFDSQVNPHSYSWNQVGWGIFDGNTIKEEITYDADSGDKDRMINAVRNYLRWNGHVLKCFVQMG